MLELHIALFEPSGFGRDTYAFATLLCAVLLGISSGGLLYAFCDMCNPRRVTAFSLTELAIALRGSSYLASSLVVAKGREPFGLGDRFIGAGALAFAMHRSTVHHSGA